MKKIVLKFLQTQAQMRILHWQTTSYAEHNAFGGFYDATGDIIDKIVEAIQGGAYGVGDRELDRNNLTQNIEKQKEEVKATQEQEEEDLIQQAAPLILLHLLDR